MKLLKDTEASPRKEKMDTVTKYIKRQEVLKQYIKKINARIAILRDDKKRFEEVYNANQAELTNTLNIKRTVVGDKELKTED